ncbi:hypothetical protein Vadar_022794 [Vaccinium darrowii]|uniref:Uncharacterized protein n=1 Tax=Vaccinium darrowii TaxID=229202 RepID=A0ACB7XT45_9ERIC|nr:hypothetical protein Vadar_022794 [Vaccinium darrowii]
MASRILDSDSDFASSYWASNLGSANSRRETEGNPTWLRKALNFGWLRLENDSYAQSEDNQGMNQFGFLLGLGLVMLMISDSSISSHCLPT